MPRLWRRRGVSTSDIRDTPAPTPLTEGGSAGHGPAPAVIVPRRGLDSDIPMGGTTTRQQSVSTMTNRRELMDQLYGAYLSCPWSSTCVDTIARTITAGGLEPEPDADATDGADRLVKPKPTSQVLELQALLDYCNPREDIRQMTRGQVTDMLVYGDAFWEVVWLLGRPVALYSLDSPTMVPIADEHGVVSEYVQVVDPGREVRFKPHEVIQVSMDTLRGGVFGVGPTQKLLLPITNWLFTAGLLKQLMRKGLPPRLHFDYPVETPQAEIERNMAMYQTHNLGIANVGNPINTRGKGAAAEFKQEQIAELLATLVAERDIITSGYGVPNRKVGIAESGSLGGAGAEAGEDRTFEINTCGPTAEVILEKVNFALLAPFGVEGWRLGFGRVDWRDDDTIEKMRDMRLRNGSWTLNRYRTEIDEPPVDGGDVPVLVDRQNLVAWSDLPALSKATVDATRAKADAAGAATAAIDGQDGQPGAQPAAPGTVTPVPPVAGKNSSETGPRGPLEETAALDVAWRKSFQQRRRQALKELADDRAA